MVERLTDSQISKFPEYIKKYIQIGLNTEPIDFEKSKKALELCYTCGNLTPPNTVVYCKSPLTAILTINILRKMKSFDKNLSDSVGASVWDSVGASVRASVWDSVGASVRDSVWDSVGASVRDSVWDSVGASVGASVRDSVWDSVGASVGASVRASVRDSVFGSVRNSVWDSIGDSVGASVWDSVRNFVWGSVEDLKINFEQATLSGQHDAGFVSFYQFFRNECGLKEQTKKMNGIFEITETAGWVYLFKDIAFVCDRPCKLYRDEKGRLHSNDCASLEYADGYKIYTWHGTRVPEYVIMNPEQITLEDILNEKNQEVRRVKIMKFGIDRLRDNNEVIKIDEHIEFGELYNTTKLKDVDNKPFAFLRVINSTPELDGTYKPYMLRVNPDIKNTVKAWQSTFRKVDNFLPIIET